MKCGQYLHTCTADATCTVVVHFAYLISGVSFFTRYVLLCILGGPRNLNETHHKLRHIVVQVQVLVVTALSLRSSKDYYGVARKDELHDDNGRRSG